jgi:general stress protein 26
MDKPASEANLKGIIEKIKDIRVAMLTTEDENGTLRSRPMANVDIDAENCIWFFTKDDSGKAAEVNQEPQVNLAFADTSNQTYVSISGTASLSHDKDKLRQLWNPMVKAYFPNGLDEPNIALLKVKIHDAEYWDSSASTMVRLFNVAKAVITGTQYDEGEHGQVRGL